MYFPYSVIPTKLIFEGGVFFSGSTNFLRLAKKKKNPPRAGFPMEPLYRKFL